MRSFFETLAGLTILMIIILGFLSLTAKLYEDKIKEINEITTIE